MSKKRKTMHQVKTRWYYWFWGAATVAVVAGQMYVGIGYRQMAEEVHNLIDAVQVLKETDDESKDPS